DLFTLDFRVGNGLAEGLYDQVLRICDPTLTEARTPHAEDSYLVFYARSHRLQLCILLLLNFTNGRCLPEVAFEAALRIKILDSKNHLHFHTCFHPLLSPHR